MQGHLDYANSFEVGGWAVKDDLSGDTVQIEINGRCVATIECTAFRDDLFKANVGDGNCGFRYIFPECVGLGKAAEIIVRSASSGRPLHGEARIVEIDQAEFFNIGNLRLFAEMAERHGDKELAQRRWSLMRQHHPGDAEGYTRSGKLYIREGNLGEARLVLESLVGQTASRSGLINHSTAAFVCELLIAKAAAAADSFELKELIMMALKETPRIGDKSYLPSLVTTLHSSAVMHTPHGPKLLQLVRDCFACSPSGASETLLLAKIGLGVPPDASEADTIVSVALHSSAERLKRLFHTRSGPAIMLLINGLVAAYERGELAKLDGDQLFGLCTILTTSGDDAPLREFCEQVRKIDAKARNTPDEALEITQGAASLFFSATDSGLPASPSISAKAPLNIALCISGQLRGYKQASETWTTLGLEGHRVRTFLHVWKDIGRKLPGFEHADRCFSGRFLEAYRNAALVNGLHVLMSRYPALFEWFRLGSSAEENVLIEHFHPEKLVIEDDQVGASMTNPQKMYYKVESCFELVEDKLQEFDLMIRFRPDRAIEKGQPVDWNGVLDECKNKRAIFTDYTAQTYPWGGYAIGDQFAASTPDIMRVYSKTYSFSKAAYEVGLYGFPEQYFPHLNFSYRMLHAGIRVRQLPVRFGGYFEPDPISPVVIRDLLLAGIGGRSRDLIDDMLIGAIEADIQSG